MEMTDAIVVQLDAEGKIRYVNRSFEEITGYTREDLENQSWFEVLVPKGRYPEVWEEFNRLISEGLPDRFENPILTKSGEERYIVWRNSVLHRDGETVGTASIGIDISERREAELALEDSEEKLLVVFNSAPAGIAVTDLENGRLRDVNEAFERLAECRYEDVIGKTTNELGLWADPSDRQRVLDLIERDGKIEDLELPMRTRTGKDLMMRVSARTVTVRGRRYLISAFADISERKRAEEQLALLKHSIDSHYDGAYWMDADDRFFYVNDAACEAVGYEREELIGQPVTLINPRATPDAMKNVWEQLRTFGFSLVESVHRRKDGSEFPVELVATYVQFGGNEYHCGFARDISERKQQELDRVRLAEQLIQAQKMEAVGRLAGGVAHNFNNILTALVGYCELLLTRLPEESAGHFEAEQIKRAADHATSVTRELLLFSRREAGRPVELDLNTVVVQTRLLLHQLLRSNVEIVTALAPTVAPVRADRAQIEQVLINLVLNASDALPNGGVVALETGSAELEQELVEHGVTFAPGRYVTLTAKDNGVGMDEETKARIFEPFFSTKSSDKGTGLGLSTVYGIVEESGGRIAVESEPGKGSVFTIFLPALNSRR
ncbi:MAG: PAS domain S-box protein [Gaiellaceae bacterium]